LSSLTDNVSAPRQAGAVRVRESRPAAGREEERRAARYPISRWYLRPAAGWLASVLAPNGIRPVHLTACGLVCGSLAAALLVWRPEGAPVAAALVLAAWFFDRVDGQLARRQQTASAWGAWLDGNVDELVDVGLHVAVAAAAASQAASFAPWFLLVGFVTGKYLLMYGLTLEEHVCREVGKEGSKEVARAFCAKQPADLSGKPHPSPFLPRHPSPGGAASLASPCAASNNMPAQASARRFSRWLRAAYHLPGNADVRVHLLVAALLAGLLSVELAVVAFYYHLRWIARYVFVARRLGARR
jgi:phosphatidylglycerophosphate synthase